MRIWQKGGGGEEAHMLTQLDCGFNGIAPFRSTCLSSTTTTNFNFQDVTDPQLGLGQVILGRIPA